MFDGLGEALPIFFSLDMFLALSVALALGMVTSIIPGIGSLTTMALLLSFTYTMDTYVAMAFLVTLLGVGSFAGSITAILINVPGETQNAATLLDGYPLSQQGRAGEAIGASATASALGASFGILVLVASMPLLRQVILSVGPPEMFALSLSGVVLIGVVSRGNPARGIASGLFGIMLAFVGLSQALGGHRYTFGIIDVYDGLPLIPIVIGLFAVPEIYELLRQNRTISSSGTLVKGGIARGVTAVLRRPAAVVRGSTIGTWIGLVPGIGGAVAPWVSYFVAKARSRDPDSFGKGNIEGVIAPETANDSKDGGALMPLLAFGIPGSLSMAILLGAFQIHGIVPGQRLFDQNMSLVWVILMALLFANFTSSLVGIAFAGVLVKVTLVPAVILSPVVLSVAMIGAFADSRRPSALAITLGMGLLAVLMVRADFPRPPLLVGFVLLPILERNFHQSLQIYRGSYTFLLRPITLGILLVTFAMMFAPALLNAWRRSRRPALATVGTAPAPADPTPATTATGRGATVTAAPALTSVLTKVLVTALILACALTMAITSRDLDPTARLFPLVVLTATIVLTGVMLVRDVQHLASARQAGLPLLGERGTFSDRWVTGWLLVLPALVFTLGMLVGSALFVALVRVFYDRAPLSTGVVVQGLVLASATGVCLFLLFERFLRITLIDGALL